MQIVSADSTWLDKDTDAEVLTVNAFSQPMTVQGADLFLKALAQKRHKSVMLRLRSPERTSRTP